MADTNMRSPNLRSEPPMAGAAAARTELTTPALNFADWVALILLIIGGINWGLVGLMNLDVVASVFGAGSTMARVVYVLVGLAGLWAIFLAVRLGRRVA